MTPITDVRPNLLGFVATYPLLVVLAVAALVFFAWTLLMLMSARNAVRQQTPSLLLERLMQEDQPSSAKKEDKPLKKEPVSGLARKLFDAGLDIDPALWVAANVIVVLALFGVGSVAVNPVVGLVLGVAGPIALRGFLGFRIGRRRLLLEEQLAQAELQIAEAARSGLSVERALLSTVRSSDDPLKDQFERVYNEISFGGLTLAEALDNFAARTDNRDVELLAAVISVQQESGSSLSEAMEFLSETVTKRIEMRRTLRSRIAETKISAAIAGVAPVLVFVFCCFAMDGFLEYYSQDPVGWIVIAAFVALEAAGYAILFKMTDFKFD